MCCSKITISYLSFFSYTQGMSDILAPILAEVRNEADVFWCFSGLMSKTIFVTSPKDEDMEKNLVRWKLRLMALSAVLCRCVNITSSIMIKIYDQICTFVKYLIPQNI